MTPEERIVLTTGLSSEQRPDVLIELLIQLREGASAEDFSAYEKADLTLTALTRLRGLCREKPTHLRVAILSGAVPACLQSSAEFEVRIELLSTREFLASWLEELPNDFFLSVVGECHQLIAPALASESFEPACWTIAEIGFRSQFIVDSLEAFLTSGDRDKCLVALGTLIGLGDLEDKKDRYLQTAFDAIGSNLDQSAVYVLSALGDPRSLDFLESTALRPDNGGLTPETAEALISVLGRIAARTAEIDVHDRIFHLLMRVGQLSEKDHQRSILFRGDVLPNCNSSHVIAFLIDVISTPYAKDDPASDAIRLALLRLTDCWLPEHLKGCETKDSSGVLKPLREILLADDGYTGRNLTPLADMKSQAVTGLLRLGRSELIQWTAEIVDREKSHYTAFQFIETMAIFDFKHLPDKIRLFITERRNLERGQDAELILRLSASRLARSSLSEEAYEALINPGLLFGNSVMRDTTEALADLCSARSEDEFKRASVSERLLELLHGDTPEPQLSSVCRALNVLALSGRLANGHIPRLTNFLLESAESLEPFNGSQIVQAVSTFPVQALSKELIDKLEVWALEREDWLSWRSTEALINLQSVESYGRWFSTRIGLEQVSEGFGWSARTETSKWASVFVVLLYGKHGNRFARAVADVLVDSNWEASERAMRTLANVVQRRSLAENSVVSAAMMERAKTGNRPNLADLSVFAHLPIISPSRLAETNWSELWPNWMPSARAALADAFQGLREPAHTAGVLSALLSLSQDNHFAVRRSATRTLSLLHPVEFERKLLEAASSSAALDRVHAAEMLTYFRSGDALTTEPRLLKDPSKTVRKTAQKARASSHKISLAELYLDRILSAEDPTNAETLLLAKYVQAIAEVGDDADLKRISDDLAQRPMPSRFRHLKAWLYKELEKEWEKRKRDWPEPLSQIQGNYVTGQGTVTIREQAVAATYELWLAAREQATDPFEWGGDAYILQSEMVEGLMGTEQWLTLEGGNRARVSIDEINYTSTSDKTKLKISGIGSFPTATTIS
jgi:hypothetical protein